MLFKKQQGFWSGASLSVAASRGVGTVGCNLLCQSCLLVMHQGCSICKGGDTSGVWQAGTYFIGVTGQDFLKCSGVPIVI
jgi:hypothetical protein